MNNPAKRIEPSPSPMDYAMFLAARSSDIASFCQHARCFANWPPQTLWSYIFFHLANRTCFYFRNNGRVAAVMFAWAMPEAEIRRSREAGRTPFAWQTSQDQADAIFLAEVVGDRRRLPKLLRLAEKRWPDWKTKHVFTWRGTQLLRLSQELVQRVVFGPALAGQISREISQTN